MFSRKLSLISLVVMLISCVDYTYAENGEWKIGVSAPIQRVNFVQSTFSGSRPEMLSLSLLYGENNWYSGGKFTFTPSPLSDKNFLYDNRVGKTDLRITEVVVGGEFDPFFVECGAGFGWLNPSPELSDWMWYEHIQESGPALSIGVGLQKDFGWFEPFVEMGAQTIRLGESMNLNLYGFQFGIRIISKEN